MATILQQINYDSLDPRQYSSKDIKVIGEYPVTSKFNPNTDTIEFYIYDINKNLISYTPEFTQYKVIDPSINQEGLSTINIDVEESVSRRGFEFGTYNVVFNFFRNQLNSSFRNNFFIKEVSSNRTELRLANNLLSNEELEEQVTQFIDLNSQKDYFSDFIVNFGENNQYIANNILLDKTDPNNYSVLIKLYTPLPLQFEKNDTLWIATEVSDPRAFKILFEEESITTKNAIPLRGPNYNINVKDQISNPTNFKSINDLIDNGSGSVTQLTSSYNQLQNVLNQKGININVNYTTFSNFCHFSSAEQRLENFYYKVGLIESSSSQISQSLNITSSYTASSDFSSSIANLEFNISDTIANFDGYENYLYYTTGSDNLTWPKSTSSPIPNLYGTGSAEVLAWYGSVVNETGLIYSASLYDEENQDNLIYTIPEYLREDSSNAPYQLFIEMMGQYFDELYLYADDITNKNNADNRLDSGISKDIVGDVLKSFGIKLYENNFSSDDLYASLIGINGSGSLNAPTGSEVIETYISASTDVIPLDDVSKETYKRIYHNMPYLLKKKGTVEGLKTLLNIFGIPDTVLRVSEFGGRDVDNASTTYDYYQNRFNYGMTTANLFTSGFVSSVQFNGGLSGALPEGVFFRFKYISGTLPANGDAFSIASASGADTTITYKGGTGVTASFSGSITSASDFSGEIAVGSARVSGSLFNGEWWNVGLSDASALKVFIGTQNNTETDGFKAGYITSSVGTAAFGSTHIFTLKPNAVGGDPGKFAFQELKFFNTLFTDQGFKDLVMNPYKLVNDSSKDSKDSCFFRAPLGADLIQGRDNDATMYTSSHPAITGSAISQSFVGSGLGHSTYFFSATEPVYLSQTQSIYYNQPYVGVKNRISDKIKEISYTIPNNTLSPFRSVIQDSEYGGGYSNPYGRDFNLTEVAFSPMNEVNDDIISTLPSFDIGQYIGDPNFLTEPSASYPALNTVRDNYFLKYYSAYEWRDYVRLIKYFNNSIFKMIQDFTPAKSSVTTGVVIKQHLLERNKYPTPQVTQSAISHDNSSSIRPNDQITGEILILTPSGSEYSSSAGTGGSLIPTSSQTHSIVVEGLNGPNTVTISDSEEFYNGELFVDNPNETIGDAALATNQATSHSMINTLLPIIDTFTEKEVEGDMQQGLFSYQESVLVTNANNQMDTNVFLQINQQPLKFGNSLHFVRSPDTNIGVTDMIIGYQTASSAHRLFTASFDQLSQGSKFNIIFTEQGLYPGPSPFQPIDIPYEFTIGNIEKFANTNGGVSFYQVALQGGVSNPSTNTYIFKSDQVLSGGVPRTGVNGNFGQLLFSGSYGPNVSIKLQIPNYILNQDGVSGAISNQSATRLLEEANPVGNSINTNRPSYIYQKVDFGAGIITASNLPLIKDGSATRAQVQDSNYTKTGHANARYNGTRASSPDFNIRSKVN